MCSSSSTVPTLVTKEWLSERLGQPRLQVLDATWYMPNTGKNGAAEFLKERIPSSKFFDIDGVSNLSIALPHMLPTETAFAAAMDALGVSNDSHVVLYDRIGLFSAPRAWWTFRVLGHDRVSILEGGLPEWKEAGLELDSSEVGEAEVKLSRDAAQAPHPTPSYTAKLDQSKVRSFEDMLHLASSPHPTEQVMDARSNGRFLGKDPEPRPGLPSGHMPGSKSVPFPSVLQSPGQLKTKEQLKEVFHQAGVQLEQPLVGSCGSGLTACILALAVHEATGKLIPVYDGSWTEWALRDDTPKIVAQ